MKKRSTGSDLRQVVVEQPKMAKRMEENILGKEEEGKVIMLFVKLWLANMLTARGRIGRRTSLARRRRSRGQTSQSASWMTTGFVGGEAVPSCWTRSTTS